MTAGPAALRVRVERLLPVPRPRAFAALTEPEELRLWWGPRGFTAPSLDVDLRVGGRYRIRMQPPEGEAFHLSGEFREVAPPERLAYTFRWEEPDPDDRETLVTLALEEAGGATRLTVDQGPFATEARRELHQQGWSESVERLHEVLSERG